MADRLTSRRHRGRLAGPTFLAAALFVCSLASSSIRAAETEFAAEPSWQPATAEAAFEQLEFYVRSQHLPPEGQSKIRDAWWQGDAPAAGDSNALLDRLATCLAMADERVAELVAFCEKSDRPAVLPEFAWLASSDVPPLVRYNMRLYYARWLGQNNYFDEAIAWTDGLNPADVVAPDVTIVLSSRGQPSASERRSRRRHGRRIARALGRTSRAVPEAGRIDAAGPGGLGRRVAGSHRAANGRRAAAAGIGPRR